MRSDTTVQGRPAAAAASPSLSLRRLYAPGSAASGWAPPIELPEGTLAIGRGVEPPGLLLENDPRVSRRHAELTRTERAVRLKDTSSSGTWVNGEAVTETGLRDGDLIRVGDTFLLFREQPSSAGPPPSSAALEMFGESPAMVAVRRMLGLVGRSKTSVLLLGETGTGKELAARALHAASGRRGPFVAVNCSAIAESLAESALFGHAQGAFTGAKKASPGFFRAADGGTLFLDEIGDLPLAQQPKLLRALEERKVIPVGETDAVPFDVRIVSATHQPLISDVAAGRFRADLYARLSEFTIELPPLRLRREDVLPILMHALGEPPADLDPELVDALLLHPWPFNVRELCKVAAELRVRAEGRSTLTRDLFEPHLAHSLIPRPVPAQRAPQAGTPTGAVAIGAAVPAPHAAPISTLPPEKTGAVPTRDELDALLRRFHGVIADVARETGRSRKQVYRWMVDHGLDAGDYRE